MKRRDLLNELRAIAREKGYAMELTEGGRHTKVRIGEWSEPIPRHREVEEWLARTILRRAKRDA